MGRQKSQTLAAVQEMHATRGALVCIACAAPRMAEIEAMAARAPTRAAAKGQLEAARHEADAAQAARGARALIGDTRHGEQSEGVGDTAGD